MLKLSRFLCHDMLASRSGQQATTHVDIIRIGRYSRQLDVHLIHRLIVFCRYADVVQKQYLNNKSSDQTKAGRCILTHL